MDTVPAEITRDIYPMPAFLTLLVADVDRTVDWYVNGLDFVVLFTLPGPGGSTTLVDLRRWRHQDILVVPGTAAASERSGAERAVKRPHSRGIDKPAGDSRDVRATDPDGYTVVYTARRPDGERDERFTALIEGTWREQSGH